MLFYGKNKCRIVDMGREPLVACVEELAEWNEAFCATLWTGESLQCLVMNIPRNGESDGALHPSEEQFIFCVAGCGTVAMGSGYDQLRYQKTIHQGYGAWIPSGYWSRITNAGKKPLKLVVVTSPPRLPATTYRENQ